MIDDADEDESGTINFPEFIGLMVKKQTAGQTKDEIKQVNIRTHNATKSTAQVT
jgi:Ca2+-binding EF-hand superfamily protein